MASSINASTAGGGGVIVTSDATGNLNIQSGGSTVVAVTAAGASVTGTLAATGAITGSSTVAGSTGILYPLTSGTAVASTSGTSIDFTGIPSWVKRITMMWEAVSSSGTSSNIIQLGTSAGIQTASYLGAGGYSGGAPVTDNYSSGYLIKTALAASSLHGTLTLTLLNASTGLWCMSYILGNTNESYIRFGAGSKTLSGTLDRIRLTTVNGTDTFDAGSVNILYE